jgi:hypothetical protein
MLMQKIKDISKNWTLREKNTKLILVAEMVLFTFFCLLVGLGLSMFAPPILI